MQNASSACAAGRVRREGEGEEGGGREGGGGR